MSKADTTPTLAGLAAEFETPEALLDAAEKMTAAGYRHTDAFTPFPVHGMNEALAQPRSRIARLMLLGGILGFCTGIGLQYWVSVVAYPHNIGGRPFFSWPSFIPVIFECTVLFTGLTGFFSMLFLNGLPRSYHPMFNIQGFERATTDRFYYYVASHDPKFDLAKTKSLLSSTKPLSVSEVPS